MKHTSHCIKVLREGLAQGAFPSAAVAVGEGSKVYFCEVMGHRQDKPKAQKAHKTTLYDLASLTKLVAPTMIALRMVEEGRLLLSDTLDRYFTAEELKNAPAGRAGVTIFQLMTHTSGITPHLPLWLTKADGVSSAAAGQTGASDEAATEKEAVSEEETVVEEATEEIADKETFKETSDEEIFEAPAIEETVEEPVVEETAEAPAVEDQTEERTAPSPTVSEIISPDQAVSVILASAPVCEPGTEVHYSCMGYILLGKILERIGGKPLDVLAKTMVFQPLGMKHTCYCPKSHDVAATEYSNLRERYICGEVHDENAHFLGGVSANAGVFAPIGDMIQFAMMLAERGKLPSGRFLSPATFDLAVKNFTPRMSEARGLGFQLQPPMPALTSMGDLMSEGSYGHTGFTGTSLYVDAKTGRWAILLTNAVHYGRDKTAFLRYRRRFHNAVMSDVFGKEKK